MKHGFEKIKSGGCIQIRGYKENGDCIFEVQDNGRGIPIDEVVQLRQDLRKLPRIRHGIGLFNVHQRIIMERGAAYGIREIDSQEGEYTRIVLRT